MITLKMYHAWVKAEKEKDINGHSVLHPTNAEEAIELFEFENNASSLTEVEINRSAALPMATAATPSTVQVTQGLAIPKASTPGPPGMSNPGSSFWQSHTILPSTTFSQSSHNC
jgi:hypothetical protein